MTKTKTVKRKRHSDNNGTGGAGFFDSKKQRILVERQSYYDRLVHQCQKDLHKQAKIAKTFECQKLIRKILFPKFFF